MFSRKLCSVVLVIIMLFSVLSLPVLAETSGSDVFEVTYKKGEGYKVDFSAQGESSEVNNVVTYKFPEGTKVKATITIDFGYKLTSVKANGINLPDAPGKQSYSLDLEVDTSIVIAVEKQQTAEIYVLENENFTYTLEGNVQDKKAVVGSQVTLKIIPSEGYKVKRILYNGEEVPAGNTYTFTVDEINDFVIIVEDEIVSDQKQLVINPTTGGTVTANGETFLSGSTVTLTVTPSAGYMLSSLTLNGLEVPLSNIVSDKYSFTITENTTVSATFIKTLTITVQVGKGGTVSINGKEVTSTIKVAEGSDVMVSVSPSLGYTIDSVKLDGNAVTLTNNAFTISAINANMRIVVAFKAVSGVKQYTITASAGAGGTITPANATVIEEGRSLTYVITPESGKEVDTVLVDGQAVSLTNNTYTFSNVASSHTITVTFKDAASTVTPTGTIGVADVNWNTDTVIIDIKNKTNISADVFKKITEDCKDKIVIFAAEKYKWTLPRGASITISSASADVAVQTNNTLYAEVSAAVSKKKENAKLMLYSYKNGVTFPEGTTLEVMLPNNFVSQEVQQLIYDESTKTLSNPKNELGDKALDVHTVSSDCWVKLKYNNDTNIVLCDVLSGYFTINVMTNAGGSVLPSKNVKVEAGGTIRFRITADEGYEIESLTVGTTEDADAQGKQTYDKVLQQVEADQNITVNFKLAGSASTGETTGGSSSLVVALIIIALAAAGGATLFIIKLRQEKY